MKWYGSLKQRNPKNNIHNYKNRINFKSRALNIFLYSKIRYNYYKVCFFLPFNWEVILLKSLNNKLVLNFYIFSFSYYFFLPVLTKPINLRFSITNHTIILRSFYVTSFFHTYWTIFLQVFSSFSKIFFKKLKFRGKGYYIYKNYRNTIAMQFGFSHRLRVYSYFLSVKFLSKTSIFIFGINKKSIYKTSYKIFFKRPINIFTGTGIRFTRQIRYKKPGKISSYR